MNYPLWSAAACCSTLHYKRFCKRYVSNSPHLKNSVITVKISAGTNELSGLYLRQTPDRSGVWGDCQFILNQPVERCDWWVVCHGPSFQQTDSTQCDPEHIVYISMEPTEVVAGATDNFLNQFSKLVICDRSVSHRDITYANGLTWWVGMDVRHENGHHFSPHFSLDYDSLMAMPRPEKQCRISVVCSNNQSLPGHHKRLAFLEKLQAHPVSEHIDFFGGGHRPIPDKWDAIAPYKYHLALENSVIPDYWSEKLGDAFLGFAYPIYYGCPNIFDYFPSDSLSIIDIDNFEQSVALLQDLIRNDPYEQHVQPVIRARNQVLNQYNIFQMMADICDQPAQRHVKCTLIPAHHLDMVTSWPRRMARKIVNRLRGIKSEK